MSKSSPAPTVVSGLKQALVPHAPFSGMTAADVELAPLGISANAIKAGVTDTPALRKIPGWESMRDRAGAINPGDCVLSVGTSAAIEIPLDNPSVLEDADPVR